MSRGRIAVMAVVVAAGLAGAMVLSRRESPRPAEPSGAEPVAQAGSPVDRTAVVTPPERPRLSAGDPAEPAGFADEPRDPRWADATEPRIREAVDEALRRGGVSAAAHFDQLECRSRHCRFVLRLDDGQRLDAVIAALEEPGGLPRVASSMRLSKLERDAGGVPTSALVTLTVPPPAGDPRR